MEVEVVIIILYKVVDHLIFDNIYNDNLNFESSKKQELEAFLSAICISSLKINGIAQQILSISQNSYSLIEIPCAARLFFCE